MIVINNKKLRPCLKIFALIFIAVAVVAGAFFSADKQYIYISLLVAVLTLVVFICGFDKRKIGSRRAVMVAVMVVLCVVGRFIPFFKPITAITILSAMFLGAEAGFATGAFSALVSSFYFGIGPWLPFQMLAWGSIGLLGGLLRNVLKKHKLILYVFAFLCGILFSLIMDIWTVLWYSDGFNLQLYLASVLTAVPTTALYCVSNIIFIALFYKPFATKLERIKTKYGI